MECDTFYMSSKWGRRFLIRASSREEAAAKLHQHLVSIKYPWPTDTNNLTYYRIDPSLIIK